MNTHTINGAPINGSGLVVVLAGVGTATWSAADGSGVPGGVSVSASVASASWEAVDGVAVAGTFRAIGDVGEASWSSGGGAIRLWSRHPGAGVSCSLVVGAPVVVSIELDAAVVLEELPMVATVDVVAVLYRGGCP